MPTTTYVDLDKNTSELNYTITPSAKLVGKNILLLQGPVGPYFKELAENLNATGCTVTHVCFNAGDVFFSSKFARKFFNATDCKFENWLEQILQDLKIDTVIYFGCERRRHVIAASLAMKIGINVISLEEGYIRPGFITVENTGNNRKSPLLAIPIDTSSDIRPELEPIPAEGSAFNRMSWYGFLYYLIRYAGHPIYGSAGHHKNRKLIHESFYWIRNVARKNLNRSKNKKLITKLCGELNGQFVIIPMQVRDDGQLTSAGRGWTNEKVIESSIKSFAEHAPQDLYLAFKSHPLERGHTDAKTLIWKLASKYSVQDRVFYLDDGSIGQLTKHAKAMLTINSTSGLSALYSNIPLAVLGEAMFRRPELALCINDISDLDTFWNIMPEVNKEANKRFIHLIKVNSLVPGDYYLRKNRSTSQINIINTVL